MPPVIHLVRHGEGYHNSAKNGEGIHDPFLTDKGRGQAEELCQNFPHHDKIDLLMASPMKRTIQTCQFAFQPAVKRGHKILLMPLAQETSDEPMDIGSSKEEIIATFGDLVDTQNLDVHPYWNRKVGTFDVDGQSLIERGRLLRKVLRERPEKNIGLASHGSFAHYVVGNVTKDGEQSTRMWANTECRSYEFVGDENDEIAELRELEESKGKRPNLEKANSGYVLESGGPRRNSAGEAKSP